MSKTREQLEKECQSTIKLVITELETLRDLDADQGVKDVYFDEGRRRVIRKIWNLFKECVNHEPE